VVEDDGDAQAAFSTAGDNEPGALDELRSTGSPTKGWKNRLGQIALLGVGLYLFSQAFAGVDFHDLADTISEASIWLLLLALVVGQLPRFTWALATQAACPEPVPYGPVALLQLAIPFFNLLAPYTVARMAVNIRFFKRQGVGSATAVSIGAIDTLGGTAAQIIIIVGTLLFGFDSINLSFQSTRNAGEQPLLHLLLVALAVVVVAALIVVIAPSLRHRLVDRLKPWLQEAGHTLAGVRSPRRLALIVGGNLASEVLQALTLTIVVYAYSGSATLATMLVVEAGVGLFASLIPIPGGIGVVEGALVVGLTAAGLDQPTAVASAVTYRLCTYYLPPIWGWFAYRALRQRGLF
jgi:uncharacterized membrane protein YbhN (UPF0104 family)